MQSQGRQACTLTALHFRLHSKTSSISMCWRYTIAHGRGKCYTDPSERRKVVQNFPSKEDRQIKLISYFKVASGVLKLCIFIGTTSDTPNPHSLSDMSSSCQMLCPFTSAPGCSSHGVALPWLLEGLQKVRRRHPSNRIVFATGRRVYEAHGTLCYAEHTKLLGSFFQQEATQDSMALLPQC